MEGDDRKKKQDYLKREILEKGYDIQEFTEFMLSQKDDGLNVDNWDARELIMVVDEFLGSHKPVENANNEIFYDEPKGPEPGPGEYPDRMDTYIDESQYNYDYDYNEESSQRDDGGIQDSDVLHRLHTNTEDDRVFDEFHRSSEKILAVKRQQEEEREKIREQEREEERKLLKKKKREERETRKKKKQDKKAKKVGNQQSWW